MNKFNVFFILHNHWRAVACDPHTGALQPIPSAFYVMVPIALGGGWASLRMQDGGLAGVLDPTAIMSAVAILIGFLLALVTWIFQLRRDYVPSEHLDATDADIPKLLDQSFYSACYGVLAAGGTALLAIPTLAGLGGVASVPGNDPAGPADVLPVVAPALEAILVVAIVHLAITVLMLLRRLAIAYGKLADEKDDEQKVLRDRQRRQSHHA